ncbi:MAG: zf-HC2 domain-containing protein [Fimbriimonadales bacterium]|nr:zf-HC2 domain-containing protein [Fimbriimonadales bacterium]
MGKTFHCPEWEEKLSLYVDGVLNPFDENAVVAHLQRCDSCRATVELWQAVGQSVRRLPRQLPPPELRERILASTTRRRRLSQRLIPGWRVLAPVLGVGLLLGWLTLPRPETTPERIVSVPTPRVQATVPAPVAVSGEASHNSLPAAPLVMVLQSAPTFRTASPAPRWLAQTRLSPATGASEPTPPAIVVNNPTPRFTPAGSATPTIVTEVVEPSETPATSAEVITVGASARPATTTATQDLSGWLQQLNQQLREEDRRQITGATQRESNKRRFFVPIVTVDLK